MIPVPDNSGGGAPPQEGSRQLSPQEERDTLLNFMGHMYGEAKKWMVTLLVKLLL